jgi:hypothetical protein
VPSAVEVEVEVSLAFFSFIFFAMPASLSVYTNEFNAPCPSTNNRRLSLAAEHFTPPLSPPLEVVFEVVFEVVLREANSGGTIDARTLSGQGWVWKRACIASSHRENQRLRIMKNEEGGRW